TQSRAARAPQRGATEALAERRVVERQQRLGLRRVRRRERRLCRDGRLAVPRADVLADVAPESPLADQRTQRLVDVTAMLDREVRDAPARVERVGRGERRGGARVET